MPEIQYSTSNGEGFNDNDKQSLVTDTVKMTQLADTDFVDIPAYIPEGKTLYIWLWGTRTDLQTTPFGLTAELYNHNQGYVVESANTKYQVGNPIVSLTGSTDASLRIRNETGSQVNAGGYFSATIK